MALLTPVSLHDARALGAHYGLEVVGVRPILAGSVNSNFEILVSEASAPAARVFLRVYEEQGAASAEREAALLDHLCTGGVRTPRPLRLTPPSASPFVSSHRGKPVAVFPWIDGRIICQAGVTPARARCVGGALARVHIAGENFQGNADTRFAAPALQSRLARLPPGALEGPLDSAVVKLRRDLDALRQGPAPRAHVIHGDLFRDNVLWSPSDDVEIAALLDFESASRGLCSFDLMVTVLAWCYGAVFNHELAAAMVAGYEEVRRLSPEDRAELFDQGRFAAVRFAITRITDFELRPRESGVYKDYRRFLDRLAALEALGPRGLDAALGLG